MSFMANRASRQPSPTPWRGVWITAAVVGVIGCASNSDRKTSETRSHKPLTLDEREREVKEIMPAPTAGKSLEDVDAVFVAPTGDDTSATGSESAPFKTIAKALEKAEPGQVVVLRAGVYNESVYVQKPRITIQSHPAEWAVIKVPSDNEKIDFAVRFGVHSSGGVLRRLEIIGGYHYAVKYETKFNWGDPKDRAGTSSHLIEDCKIHDTGFDGIKIPPNCNDITIRRTEIYNTGLAPGASQGQGSAEGIDNVNGSRMLVQDSYIHDTLTTCIYAKGGPRDVIIERTRVENCGLGGIFLGFETNPEYLDVEANPGHYEAVRGIIRNNIIVNTQGAGIGLFASQDSQVYNNTVINAGQTTHAALFFGVVLQAWLDWTKRPPNVNPVIVNNIFTQSAKATRPMVEIRFVNELGGVPGLTGPVLMDHNIYYREGGRAKFTDRRPRSKLFDAGLEKWKRHIGADASSIEANPRVDDRYHLADNSPAIDKGVAVKSVTLDIDGDNRTAAPDIGADERVVK